MDDPGTYKLEVFLLLFSSLFFMCTAQTVALRLADGYSQYEGRVEVFFQGEWGTVFLDNFYWAEAHVVCRELNFGGVDEIFSSSYFGSGTGEVLNCMSCSGHETEISECMTDASWLFNSSLYHHLDAGLRCYPKANPIEDSIRLVGGNLPSEGRVELYHSSRWGTVCDSVWSILDADVVCRQLGYPGALSAENGGTFDQGTGEIWFDYVECSGYEDRLTDCFHGAWFETQCSHHNDAGVRCIEPEYLTPRLTNGSEPREGRLEVWTGQQWERVCQDEFNSYAKRVVCRQLGYHADESEHFDTAFGNGDTMPSAIRFDCYGPDDETSLFAVAECDLHSIERYDCDGVSIICFHEEEEKSFYQRFRVYLIIGGVLIGISILSSFHYAKMKKRKNAQTNPDNTPCPLTSRNCNVQSPRLALVVDTAMRDEMRPAHHLPPMDKPPTYSESVIAPPSYGHTMAGQQSDPSSFPRQPTMNMQSNGYVTMNYFNPEGHNADSMATPSRDTLYEGAERIHIPAPPDITTPKNLPPIT